MLASTLRVRKFLRLPKNTWALNSTSALWSVGGYMASPFQVLYFAALGASPFQIGLLVAYSTGVAIITMIIGGYLADSWSRRKPIIIFSWLSVLGSLLFVFINSDLLIVVPLTLTSAANIYTPAFNSIMMDEISPQDRIRAFSIAGALSSAPGIFMPTVGGLFLSHFGTISGTRIDYLCNCLFGVVAVALRTVMLKDAFTPSTSGTKGISSRISESFVGGVKSVRRSNSSVKRLLVYVALTGVGTGLTSTLVPLFAITHLSINPTAYSVVVDISGLVTVCLYLVLVILIERIGARRSILLSSVASSVSNIFLTQAKNANELVGWGVSTAFYTVLLSPSLSAVQAETIPRQDRGKILAVFGVLPNVAALPSQILAGILYSGVSPVAPFLLSLLPFTVAAVLLYSIE
jgi:MFS transporter, DHA1 family, tetracycline resistance protein